MSRPRLANIRQPLKQPFFRGEMCFDQKVSRHKTIDSHKSFHNKGVEIQTAWINKMLRIRVCYEAGQAEKHLTQIKLLQQTARSKYIFPESIMKVQVALHRFWLPSCPDQHIVVWILSVPFGIGGGRPCLILILPPSYILPIWRYHNAISHQIQDQKGKKGFFSPKTQNSPK